MNLEYQIYCLLVRNVAKLIYGLSVRGLENVPREGKLLIAANHQSYLDPPLLGSILPREIYYLAKKELFRNRLFGALLRRVNSIPINRTGQDLGSLRRALAVLQNGEALLVFPEGTRGRTGEFRRPTRGLGLLAKQSEAPVVPVYIHGTRGFWRRPFQIGAMRIAFGEPLKFAQFNVEYDSSADAVRAFSELVMNRIAALKSELMQEA
jgi:1-acyl-sn-glycerol-3-phosphate acyltransferase